VSLLLAKLASSTSPQKPPATYTQVNDSGPHTDSIFRGATYMRERLTREYIRYSSSIWMVSKEILFDCKIFIVQTLLTMTTHHCLKKLTQQQGQVLQRSCMVPRI